ncbi:MAG: hypothetical protein F9K23_12720 [Bacteroidetes bacterium]|nr:MAG: hypothetical protein F9K23_12720 [Bacteroidota bacterium]
MSLKIEVLNALDNSHDGGYKRFVWFNDIYSYLIESRLNVFRGKEETWAIAIERVGFNPRAGNIFLSITYFGNCLTNLERYNNYVCNDYQIGLLNDDEVEETIDVDVLKEDAKHWTIRGQKIPLVYTKADYKDAGVNISDYDANAIGVEAVARVIAYKHKTIFCATDQELYKSIPSNLDKILVLDEWYHIDYQRFSNEFHSESMNGDEDNDKPSSYETWQMIADVITSGNANLYKPTLKPNTHWSNYPESGTF